MRQMTRFKALDEIELFVDNPIDIILGMTEFLENQINDNVINIPKISSLRLYTHEDEADELATLITYNSEFELSSLDKYLRHLNEKDTNECKRRVQSGTRPLQGSLVNVHHTECWRFWRAKQIVDGKYLFPNKKY